MSCLISLILLIRFADALMGYDCELPHRSGTLFSLLDWGSCEPLEEPNVSRHVYLELLRKSKSVSINLLSCRVELETTIEQGDYKGFVKFRRSYLPLDLSMCIELQLHGRLRLQNDSFDALQPNVTNSRLLPATNINPLDGTQRNHHVNSYIHVLYSSYSISLTSIVDKFTLPSGARCTYSDLQCLDEDGFYNFWSPLVRDGCTLIPHTVVYRGPGKRIHLPNESIGYTFTHNNVHILFLVRTPCEICNITAYQMEHPLFIVREYNDVASLNQKFVNRLRSLVRPAASHYYFISTDNPTSIYVKAIFERCSRRTTELRTAALTSKDPESFAYSIMGGPGYTARIRGEAAQIISCTPVPVQRRQTETCFMELPVTVHGEPRYLLPRSRIIVKTGTETTCDPTVTALYKIHGQWYSSSPETNQVAVTTIPLQLKTLSWGRHPKAYDTTKEEDPEHLGAKPSENVINSNTSLWENLYTVIMLAVVLILLPIVGYMASPRKTEVKGNSPPQTRSALTEICRQTMKDTEDKSVLLGRDNDQKGSRSLFTVPWHTHSCIVPLEQKILTQHQKAPESNTQTSVPAELSGVTTTLRGVEDRLNRCTSILHPLGSRCSPSQH